MQIVHPAPIERAALIDFLDSVLPAKGEFCVWSKASKRHVWADSHGGLADLVLERLGEADWYFATASFDRRERKQAHVSAKRCLYIDVDCGAEKHSRAPEGAYASQRDAAGAIVGFHKATGLLPSFIIDSGAGLHAYWSLATDCAPADWQPLAAALKRACAEHGLRADPACTADSARLLRPLGALHSNGRRVRLLKATGKTWTLEALRERLAAAVKSAAPAAAVPALAAPAERVRLDVNSGLSLTAGFPRTPDNERLIEAALEAIATHVNGTGGYPRSAWLETLFALASLDRIEGWAGAGEALALTHSKATPNFTGDDAVLAAVRSYDPTREPKITIGSLLHRAQALGWQRPADVVAGAAADAIATAAGAHPLVAEVNREFFVAADEAGRPSLWREVRDAAGRPGGLACLTREQFALHFDNQRVRLADKGVPLAAFWRASPNRRQYRQVVCDPEAPPTNPQGGGDYNRWSGFAVEPVEGDATPALELIREVCGTEAAADYCLMWIASKLQRPGLRPETALVLRGAEGVGKGSIAQLLMRPLGRHAVHLFSANLLTGAFNEVLIDALAVFADEAVWAGDKAAEGTLKGLITESQVAINPKGRAPVIVRNRLALLMSSNESWVIPAGPTARRYSVIDVSPAKRGDRRFFDRLHRWLEREQGYGKFLAHCQALDLTGFNPREILRGAALDRQKVHTMRPIDRWMLDCLTAGRPLDAAEGADGTWPEDRPAEVRCAGAVAALAEYARRSGTRHNLTDSRALGEYLRGIFGAGGAQSSRTGAGHHRARVWLLAPLGAARAAFAAKFELSSEAFAAE
jgi:hypothetical protein